jgi:hypothetical protein
MERAMHARLRSFAQAATRNHRITRHAMKIGLYACMCVVVDDG